MIYDFVYALRFTPGFLTSSDPPDGDTVNPMIGTRAVPTVQSYLSTFYLYHHRGTDQPAADSTELRQINSTELLELFSKVVSLRTGPQVAKQSIVE